MMIARQLARSRRGVTIVEFALIAPIMLLLICGTIEIGNQMFARQVLEGSVMEAARIATATLETTEADRAKIMRDRIARDMKQFPTAPGTAIDISTKVYADFASVTPEIYTDSNKNGSYDVGEPYIDRNKNGKWDPSVPKSGALGGPGDVVAYSVKYPKRALFGFVAGFTGTAGGVVPLSATTVVRNETLRRKS